MINVINFVMGYYFGFVFYKFLNNVVYIFNFIIIYCMFYSVLFGW